MRLVLNRVGDVVKMDAEGTPEELAAYSKACGLTASSAENTKQRRVSYRGEKSIGGLAIDTRDDDVRGTVSVVKWDHLCGVLSLCPISELEPE